MKVTVTLPHSEEAYTIISQQLDSLSLPLKPDLSDDYSIEYYKNSCFQLIVNWNDFTMTTTGEFRNEN